MPKHVSSAPGHAGRALGQSVARQAGHPTRARGDERETRLRAIWLGRLQGASLGGQQPANRASAAARTATDGPHTARIRTRHRPHAGAGVRRAPTATRARVPGARCCCGTLLGLLRKLHIARHLTTRRWPASSGRRINSSINFAIKNTSREGIRGLYLRHRCSTFLALPARCLGVKPLTNPLSRAPITNCCLLSSGTSCNLYIAHGRRVAKESKVAQRSGTALFDKNAERPIAVVLPVRDLKPTTVSTSSALLLAGWPSTHHRHLSHRRPFVHPSGTPKNLLLARLVRQIGSGRKRSFAAI